MRSIANTQLNERVSVEDVLFCFVWMCLLMVHFRLCYPAMVSRGNPPLIPEHICSLFIVPLFVWLPAFFGDAKTRTRGVFYGSLGFSLIYAIVIVNLNSIRPHIGHTHGVLGIIDSEWWTLIVYTVILYVPVSIALYFFERVLGDYSGRLYHSGKSIATCQVNWQK